MIVEYSFIIAVIPVILVVAFLVWIAKKITDGERLDMKEGALGVVILMVAVLIMVPMVSSTQVYTWDEDTGELVIQQNIFGGSYAWDTYDDQIRSIVIKPGVTQIGNSAFDGATNLEYLSIPESVTDIGANAFADIFRSPTGATIQPEPGQEYIGFGTGAVYSFDGSVFTYDSTGTAITGSSETLEAVMVPETYNGKNLIRISSSAFSNNTSIIGMAASDLLQYIDGDAFNGCTGLGSIKAQGVLSLGNRALAGCTSLTEADFPNLASCGAQAFDGDAAIKTVDASSLRIVYQYAFRGLTAIEKVSLGSLDTISGSVFPSWTFYASDGTTVLEQTTDNLAGKTFEGTAAALIEVAPGQLSLTPLQLQQVQLHTQELQDLKDQISIEPLPLQPSLQEQELTA